MVKKSVVVGVLVLILSGCASGTAIHDPDRPGSESVAERLWSKKSGGILVELSAAAHADAKSALIVASVIPDFDVDGGVRKNQIQGWSEDGKLLWRLETKTPVKSQAIAHDGSMVTFSTYDDRVTAISASGEQLWAVEGVCRPIPVIKARTVLCFHDDDAEPETAFDLLDWSTGIKVASFPTRKDALNLKVAQSERYFVTSFTGGKIALFELTGKAPGFKLIWEKKLKGEILDIAVTGGTTPSVVTLTSERKIQVFDGEGKLKAEASPRTRVEQLEVQPTGTGFLAYDNSQRGQALLYFDIPTEFSPMSLKLEEKWNRRDPEPSNYMAPLVVTADALTVRFENSTGRRSMRGHLISLDSEGKTLSSLPLEYGEGSQLYARLTLADHPLLIVATDEGEIRAYRPKSPFEK